MKKFILSLIPFACAVAACNTVSIEQPVQYGELSIALADEPVLEVETKAAETLDKTSEAAKDYTVRVFNSSNQQQGEDVSYYAFETMKLPLGTYYVTAENCSEADAESGNGKMRIAGQSSNVTLDVNNLSQEPTVSCGVTNAKVTVAFDSSVSGKFSNLKVVLEGGTERTSSLTVNETEAGVENETWFNPSTLNYTISGKFNSLDKDVSLTGSRTLEAKDNIKILVKVNLENGQLSIATIEVDDSINMEEDIEEEFNPYN